MLAYLKILSPAFGFIKVPHGDILSNLKNIFKQNDNISKNSKNSKINCTYVNIYIYIKK